jgi:hypothetical protein
VTLIRIGADQNALKSQLANLGGRVAARYAVFLRTLAQHKLDLKLDWASPAKPKNVQHAEIPWGLAQATAEILLATIEEFTEQLLVRGRLEGIDVDRKTFNLVNLDTSERLSGKVLDDYVSVAHKAAAQVPADYTATLIVVQEVNPTTGEVRDRYQLSKLEKPSM